LDCWIPAIQASTNPFLKTSSRESKRALQASQATAIGTGEFALPNHPEIAQFENTPEAVGPLSTRKGLPPIEGISPFEQPSPNDRLSLFSNTGG